MATRSDEILEDRQRKLSNSLRASCAPPSSTSRTIPVTFTPPKFDGSNTDADAWLAHLQRYVGYRQLPEDEAVAMFPLFLKDTAIDWYEMLPGDVKNNWEALKDEFHSYFGKSPLDIFLADETVFTRIQRSGEKVRDYVAQMQKLASRMPALTDDLLLWTICRGLRPQIKAAVIQQKNDIKSVADLLELAKLAESAGLGNEEASDNEFKMAKLMDEVRAGRDEVQKLTARMAGMSVSVTQLRSPTPERQRRQPHASFQEPNVTSGRQRAGGSPTYYRGGRMLQEQSRPYNGGMDRRFSRSSAGMQSSLCIRCGCYHTYNRCPAMRATCYSCGRMGHFRANCRSAKRGVMDIVE